MIYKKPAYAGFIFIRIKELTLGLVKFGRPMLKIRVIFKQAVWVTVLSVLSACGNDIARISDSDLREKIQECDYAMNMTAARHQICTNYHKECKRRVESEGRFVCK